MSDEEAKEVVQLLSPAAEPHEPPVWATSPVPSAAIITPSKPDERPAAPTTPSPREQKESDSGRLWQTHPSPKETSDPPAWMQASPLIKEKNTVGSVGNAPNHTTWQRDPHTEPSVPCRQVPSVHSAWEPPTEKKCSLPEREASPPSTSRPAADTSPKIVDCIMASSRISDDSTKMTSSTDSREWEDSPSYVPDILHQVNGHATDSAWEEPSLDSNMGMSVDSRDWEVPHSKSEWEEPSQESKMRTSADSQDWEDPSSKIGVPSIGEELQPSPRIAPSLDDSYVSTLHSETESGQFGSMSSLGEADATPVVTEDSEVSEVFPPPRSVPPSVPEESESNEQLYPRPQSARVVLVENGVHYFEDGHFWMEVSGLPESDDDHDNTPAAHVKKSSKVLLFYKK